MAILKVGANSESELSWKIRKTIDASNASKLALKDGVVKGAGLCLAEIETNNEILANAIKKPQELISVVNQYVHDPAIVVKSALTTAVSLAGIILTIKGALLPRLLTDQICKEIQ